MVHDDEARVVLSGLIVRVYLPTALLSLSTSAVLPIAPLLADGVGASLAVAGLATGAAVVGQMAGVLPAGWGTQRFGAARVMGGSAGLIVASTLSLFAASEVFLLAISMFIMGAGTAGYTVSRHAFVTIDVPRSARGRSLSLLGGSMRLGGVLGPLLGFAASLQFGGTRGPLLVAVAAAVVACIFGLTHAKRRKRRSSEVRREHSERQTLRSVLSDNSRALRTVGVAASLVSGLRTARVVIVPLWALSIGLDAAQTSLLVGLAACFDLAFFYLGGLLMDRFGPLAAGLPSVLGLSFGMLLVGLSPSNIWFVCIVMVMGLANGLGSGFLLTVGSNLVDPDNPGPGIGAFRLISDSGSAAAPLLIAGLTAALSLPIACFAAGVAGLFGAGMLRYFIPKCDRTLPRG